MGSKDGRGEPVTAGDGGVLSLSVDSVWRENRHWISAVLMAHKPGGADLEDLLQDVASSLVEHAGDLRDPEAVGPWLRTVAMNTARAEGRKQTRRARLAPITQRDPSAVPEKDARSIGAGEKNEIKKWVDKLPIAYREPLLLRSVRGMTNRQVGEILGLSESAVESRIARARRMLRNSLRADELASDTTGQRVER